jgi:prepilin-type N-terminal cleavage/methylation domain-containing protein
MRRLTRMARSRAFTVVELLIVIAVLVIAAAIVIPSIGSAADTQAISAARVLGSDLEVTRSLALTTQQPHSLVFSPDRQSYKVLANYSGGPYASAVAIAHPVRIVGPAFGGKTYVTFNSQGEPSSDGTVTVESGQVQMQVSVAALTGAVTVTRISG